MTSKGALILALLGAFALTSVSSESNKVFCYFGSWSIYYQDEGKFEIENFDPWMCSHLLYAFADINGEDGSIQVYDSWADLDLGGYKKVNDLKSNNYYLKTLLSVGGWNAGSGKFSAMASQSSRRANFIQSAVKFLSTYGFDGLDIDWEYPGQREGSNSADKDNFVTLLRELREEFDKHGYILTAAVSAIPAGESYDVPQVSKYLDYINLMTYDFHGTWEDVTGENAPLYGGDDFDVDSSVSKWLDKGADPQKIVLGLAFYGHNFQLSDPGAHGIGAKSSGPGQGGPFMQSSGTLGFNEICWLQQRGGWTVEFSEAQQVPFMYKGEQWVGYDDVDSILRKVKYAESRNLAGVMMWSIENDDFRGMCGEKLPLLQAIHWHFYPQSAAKIKVVEVDLLGEN